MGYMGFGMRKEDYQRKPKKFSEKFKRMYGKDVPKPENDPSINPPTFDEIINKKRTWSLFDSGLFKWLRILAVISIILFAAYHIFILPELKNRAYIDEREIYRQELIGKYTPAIDSMFAYATAFPGLDWYEFDRTGESRIIIIRTNSLEGLTYSSKEVVAFKNYFRTAIDFEFEGEDLIIQRKDSTHREDHWVLTYQSRRTNDQFFRILDYAGIEAKEVRQLREKLYENKLISISNDGEETILQVASSRFGRYGYVRTKEPVTIEHEDLIRIDSLTYLKHLREQDYRPTHLLYYIN